MDEPQRAQLALRRGGRLGWSRRPWLGYAPAALLIALLSLFIHDYRFGVADQAQYLTQVIAVEDAAALGDDPYLAAFPALRSVFWPAVATISTEANRPLICLAVMIVITWLNAMLLIAIGRTIAARRRFTVAALMPALLLVVPKEQNWFGLVSISDLELTATVAVLPCVFSALLLWLRGRVWWALLMCAIAAPIHGQTAAYLLTAWWCAAMFTSPRRARWILIAVAALGAVAILLERAASTLPADTIAVWRAIGESLYPELINPLHGPWRSWLSVGVLLAVGACSVMGMRGRDAASPAVDPSSTSTFTTRLCIWFAASLAFPAVGLVLLAIDVQEPLLWKLMVGRSFMLPQIAAIVLLAAWWLRTAQRSRAWALASGACAVLIAVWPFAWIPDAASSVLLISVLVILVASSAAALPHGRVSLSARQCVSFRRDVAVCAVAVAVVMVGVWRGSHREHRWLATSADSAWVDVQHWARDHTDIHERLLTPPYLSGWRIGAHRASVGEVMDGGLLFYCGEAALDWAQRMSTLGVSSPYRWDDAGGDATRTTAGDRQAFARIIARRGDELCREHEARYAVTENAHTMPGARRVYMNERFTVWDAAPVNTWRLALR